jgi:formylmethanofuran dehydrogenase subunit E
MNNQNWDRAVAFHGHACPGLAIGVKVCEAVMAKMNIERAEDEELVCITENDACGIDAIQALLGCTVGKGNLIMGNSGKHVFVFFNRKNGDKLRIYYRGNKKTGHSKAKRITSLLDTDMDELFLFGEPTADLPEKARNFATVVCEACGEGAPEHKIRLQDGKKVCLDCFDAYRI